MFRDEAQRARVCRTLVSSIGLDCLWSKEGPTGLVVVEHLKLSRGQRAILRAAWTFWNGSKGLSLSALLRDLDSGQTEMLCFLLMATKYGDDAVDDWVTEYATQRRMK